MVSPDAGHQPGLEAQLEQELRHANDEWAQGLAHRDGAALDRIMADDFVLAYPFEGDDKGQFIADVMTGDIRVESLEHQNVSTCVSGGMGLIFGTEIANWHYRGHNLSGSYRFVRVYTRRHDGWKILALHLCSPHRR